MKTIMFPVIALVGQRTVGKSTLFNRLTFTNAALVSNSNLGCTRDRQYGYIQYNKYKSVLIDTGGFDESFDIKLQNSINNQIFLAIQEAHIIFVVVSGRFKESSVDYSIIAYLRKLEKDVFVVVNKVDDFVLYKKKYIVYDYYSLGIKNVIAVSAIHGYGINNLLEQAFLKIHKKLYSYNVKNVLHINSDSLNKKKSIQSLSYNHNDSIKLAIVGRPNSGKSTFINFILKTNRMITSSISGTTRDCIYIPTVYNNQKYILIDTAGVRKKRKINDIVERVAVSKTFQVLKDSNITLFMLDAYEGVVDQDLSLLRLIADYSKSLIIVINKWDLSGIINTHKHVVESFLYTRINFLPSFKVHFISSLYGSGIKFLFKSLKEIYTLSMQNFSTSQLTRIMYKAVIKYPPPLICGTRIAPKPKYVHIGGYEPITIVVHGTQVSKLSCEYRRYLKNFFYQELHLNSILVRIRFKDSNNPFAHKV